MLLRAGALSGWIGSAQQIWGAQEAAKDLISESATIFERLGLEEKVAEARIDLAICYWREGGYDEARVMLQQILQSLEDRPSEQKLRALLTAASWRDRRSATMIRSGFTEKQLRFSMRAAIMPSEASSIMSLRRC